MRRGTLKAVLLALFLSSYLRAQNDSLTFRPDWVNAYLANGAYDPGALYYSGIGVSMVSQEEADAKARREFALNVEVHVRSVYSEVVHEMSESFSQDVVDSLILRTDMELRGINITARYGTGVSPLYLSLIQVRRAEYAATIKEELMRTVERQRAENLAREEQELEQLRQRTAMLEIERQTRDQELREMEFRKQQYGEFMDAPVPLSVLTLRNQAFDSTRYTLSARISVSPFFVPEVYYASRWWRFETFGTTTLRNGAVQLQDFGIMLNIVSVNHDMTRFSLSAGAVSYACVPHIGTAKELTALKFRTSARITGTTAFPKLAYSYVSVAADARKVSVGAIVFPLFKNVKQALGLVLQTEYVSKRDWRNRFGDPVLVQAGIRFQAPGGLSSTFGFENHEHFIFAVEILM